MKVVSGYYASYDIDFPQKSKSSLRRNFGPLSHSDSLLKFLLRLSGFRGGSSSREPCNDMI